MRRMTVCVVLALMVLTGLDMGSASAQVFGTFAWQMQPYCNVVTLTIAQIPGGFTIDGNDNQCGAGKLAGAAGMALVNPDGTVGLEFTIVTAPAARAVHVSASLSPATGSGPWTDSVGNGGTLALGANAAGLPVRPSPASGLPPSVITTVELAPGAVGVADINTSEVQARVIGTCAPGQYMVGVSASGGATCVGTARSGQTLTGTVADIYVPGGAGFFVAGASYPWPLPIATPAPTFEFRPTGSVSATCPGAGLSSPGRLCVYGIDVRNVTTVNYASIVSPHHLYGFTVSAGALDGSIPARFFASWAYQVP